MPTSVACAHCGDSLSISNWSLLPSVPPESFTCARCGGRNLLGISTLLLAVSPTLLLIAAIARAAKGTSLEDIGLMLALASAPLGLAIGAGLAKHFARLRKWRRPLI